jgi:hypothetical protein
MNPLHPDRPIRNTLKRLTLAISPVILACCLASQAQAQWSSSAWTNDADSGITNASSYTVAVNFGGAATTVNGVAFQASALAGPNFSIGGDVAYSNRTPNITGDSLALASNFVYGGNPRTVTLTNLTPGATYETSLFAFGWDAAPTSRSQTFASGSDSLVLDQNFYGQNQGVRITYTFVADSSGSQELTITPVADDTFHMSALANRRVSPTSWSYSAWTSDEDSGITNASPYTVAVNFGGTATTVNGVAFQASALTGLNFSIGGDVAYSNRTPNITGDSLALASNFVFGGTPRTVTLTNLTPGATYETSLFAFGWDAAPTSRSQTFASGSDSLVLDQNFYGQNQGVRITYSFVADSSGSKVLSITPVSSGNFHMSALANRRVAPPSLPYSAWSTLNWTDDSSLSFITSTNVTHSGDFVKWAPVATINGHTFETISISAGGGAGFTTPYSGSNFTIGSSAAMVSYDWPVSADVGGGGWGTASYGLSTELLAPGTATVTYNLTGLSTNTNYEFYLFSPEWTDTGRTGVLDGSDDVANTFAIDQSAGAGDKIIKYAYNTGASTTFTMTVTGTGLHHYGFVNVVPEPGASSYSTWASSNGIPGEPASGDFDKDGLTNLVEYALGLSPTVSSVPPGTFNGSLLSFNKGTEAMANGDVTYEIEQSTTLSGWTVVVPNAPASASISYTLPSGQPKEFARLKITQIP